MQIMSETANPSQAQIAQIDLETSSSNLPSEIRYQGQYRMQLHVVFQPFALCCAMAPPPNDQAQRRRPRDAERASSHRYGCSIFSIATATARRRSLQRMVRRLVILHINPLPCATRGECLSSQARGRTQPNPLESACGP